MDLSRTLLPSGIITKLEKIRKQNFRTFNEIASEYHARRRSPWAACVTPLAELGENSLILDVGAGTGRQTVAMAKEELNVIAVDFAVSMLQQLSNDMADLDLGARISIVLADIAAQPFRNGIFDGIEMVAALHHIPSRRLRSAAVLEICRITRRQGRLVTSVWFRSQQGFNRALVSSAFNALLRRSEWGDVSVPWGDHPRFYHLFSEDEAKSLFSNSGFRIEGIGLRNFSQDDAKKINRNILLHASKI